MLSSPYDKYKTNSINTASKEELTLMLYDGCIKFMNLAQIAIQNKDIQKSHTNLVRAQDIIIELNATLNMDIEMSKDLRRLYDFVLDRLSQANMKKDSSLVEDAKMVIIDLRDAWKEAILKLRKA